MAFAAPQGLELSKPVVGYFPATFLERGVAIPFTTPDLAGTRVRPGARVPLELLVPNLSGSRGVYILPWTKIQALCRPTLHDLRLIDAIAEQRYITPSDIRTAALNVAREGLAGREAAAAARACRMADQNGLLDAYFEMLLGLLPQVEPVAGNARSPEHDTPAEREARTRDAMTIFAPELGLTVPEMARLLEEIAALYLHLGIGAERARARIPKLETELATVRQEAAVWWQTQPLDGGTEAGLLAMAADLTLSCVRATMADAQALTTDIRALIQRWRDNAGELAKFVARSEWLIDGWDRVIELWSLGRTQSRRRDILSEIVPLLPVVPKEAAEWVNFGFNIQEALQPNHRKIILYEDWRTGSMIFDMVARNEHLLARMADYEHWTSAPAAAAR